MQRVGSRDRVHPSIRSLALDSLETNNGSYVVFVESLVVRELDVRCQLLFVSDVTFTPRVGVLEDHRIGVGCFVVAIQLIGIFLVVHDTVVQHIAEQTFHLQTVPNVIFYITLQLNNTLRVFVFTRQIIVQPSEVGTCVGRGQGRIVRIVVGKRTLGRQVTVSTETGTPVVIDARNTRVVDFLDTTVHRHTQFQAFSHLRIQVHLYVVTLETTVVHDHGILVQVTQRYVVVDLVRTTGDVGVHVVLRSSLPNVVEPIERHITLFGSLLPLRIVFLAVSIVSFSLNSFRLNVVLDVRFSIGRFREG